MTGTKTVRKKKANRATGHADVVVHTHSMTPAERALRVGQYPVVIWMTGLSGSGKSTLADAVETKLSELGRTTTILDGDNLRTGLNNDLGFSEEDRRENVRRVGEVAKLMCDAGVIPIVALVSPFAADRDAVRSILGDDQFIEVFVDTPIETCSDRDPKGLYRRAKAGEIANLTGVGQDYEPPARPEVHAHGDTDLSANVDLVIEQVLARQNGPR